MFAALCRYCGGPIKSSRKAGGWLHAAPLAAMRVSHNEYRDVIADPPRKGQPLHRQTVLHPAQPE